MPSTIRPTVILAVAICLCGIGSPAPAGSLKSPSGTTAPPAGITNVTAGTPKITVTATPNPAVFIANGNCPWLLPALSAEGFAKADSTNPRGYVGTNGWTIKFAELQGSFTRQVYYPWADKSPEYTLNGITAGAINERGNGGDVFSLTYAAAGKDPTGVNAEWIQVIKTNAPTAQEKAFGFAAANGYTYVIDDFWKGNTPSKTGKMNPTYDGGYTVMGSGATATYDSKSDLTVDPTTFIDTPTQPLTGGLNTQFQVFLVTDTNKTLTIYDGVWWGYQATAAPEPSTWILLLSGCGIVALARRLTNRERAELGQQR